MIMQRSGRRISGGLWSKSGAIMVGQSVVQWIDDNVWGLWLLITSGGSGVAVTGDNSQFHAKKTERRRIPAGTGRDYRGHNDDDEA